MASGGCANSFDRDPRHLIDGAPIGAPPNQLLRVRRESLSDRPNEGPTMLGAHNTPRPMLLKLA